MIEVLNWCAEHPWMTLMFLAFFVCLAGFAVELAGNIAAGIRK